MRALTGAATGCKTPPPDLAVMGQFHQLADIDGRRGLRWRWRRRR
ncbi:MAG TPA: hypothetical protein VMU20_21950 [Candidatus Dormibacteraeota bacterium]|nr:hypothetical protein [Candidatus Dormibacteraeota bacterium]